MADSRRLAAIGPLLGIAGAAAIGVAIHAADFRAPYPLLVRPALYAAGAILIIGRRRLLRHFLDAAASRWGSAH